MTTAATKAHRPRSNPNLFVFGTLKRCRSVFKVLDRQSSFCSRRSTNQILRYEIATNVFLYGDGDEGALRSVETADGTPTITVEMGRAHRFQPLEGVDSVFAEYKLRPDQPVHWPGWYKTTSTDSTKRWLRADTDGLVEMEWGPYPLVHEGDVICIGSFQDRRTHSHLTVYDGAVVLATVAVARNCLPL
jgi:hypothetical protein